MSSRKDEAQKLSRDPQSIPDFGSPHDNMWRGPQSISRASTPSWQAMLARHMESQSSRSLPHAPPHQEGEPPIRSAQSLPNFGSPHDNIWLDPQSISRGSTSSWQEMLSRHLESLSLRPTSQGPRVEEKTPSRTLTQERPLPARLFPPDQPQPPPPAPHHGATPYYILPPPQPQAAFGPSPPEGLLQGLYGEPAQSGENGREPPRRPTTRRSNPSESTRPVEMVVPTATQSSRQTSPPRDSIVLGTTVTRTTSTTNRLRSRLSDRLLGSQQETRSRRADTTPPTQLLHHAPTQPPHQQVQRVLLHPDAAQPAKSSHKILPDPRSAHSAGKRAGSAVDGFHCLDPAEAATHVGRIDEDAEKSSR